MSKDDARAWGLRPGNGGASRGTLKGAETKARRIGLPGNPATADQRYYDPDETEFIQAIRDYQVRSGRKFPCWSEVLGVLKGLGYEKSA
jgi:hypothetical protein